MITKRTLDGVAMVYNSMIYSLDHVLVGQEQVKSVVASSLLCDTNSRILFTGNTGVGKTTLANFLASGLNSERISVTSDMIPSDVQEQLRTKQNMQCLQIDEFNRASGKLQSTFIELLAENQMTVNGEKIPFSNFYVLASQNSADIAGIFNVPQAVYDRFDVNIYFENLSDAEKRILLFQGFEPEKNCSIDARNLDAVKRVVDHFTTDSNDENIMMKIFNLIDSMQLDDQPLFAGSNIRAHKFALRLVKLYAMRQGREYIMPTDILDFLNYVYMHRIDQNVARIGDKAVKDTFDNVKDKIYSMKRRRKHG